MRSLRFDPVVLSSLVLWTLVFGVLTVTVADPDLWGHVRFGLDIVRERALPTADPYSFTSDRPWVNHEWLSEVFMGLSYLAAGAAGLAVLKQVLLVGAFYLLGLELRARGVAPVARDILVVFAVIGCLFLTKTVRPQTFSLVLFVALLVCLRRAEDGNVRALFAIPVLFVPWANLHGGWIVGLGVIGLWTSMRALLPLGVPRWMWVGAGAASVLATLVTPYGVGLWKFLLETVRFGRADISEWQSVTTLPLADLMIWSSPVILAAVSTAREMPRITHAAVVVLLAAASFKVMRLTPFLVVATVCLAGPAFRARLPGRPRPLATGAAAFAALAVFVLAAAGVTAEVSRRNLGCISVDVPWAGDHEAGAFIRRAELSGRMLSWFDWGEYAIWHLGPRVQVSMDGRRETVYTNSMLDLHDKVSRAEPGWEEGLALLNPDIVWLPLDVPLLGRLPAMGWHRAFAGSRSVVFTREPLEFTPDSIDVAPKCFPG